MTRDTLLLVAAILWVGAIHGMPRQEDRRWMALVAALLAIGALLASRFLR